MYRVTNGNYICNIKVGDTYKTFYEGEILPEDYEPPLDYITPNKIVEKIEKNIKQERKNLTKGESNG